MSGADSTSTPNARPQKLAIIHLLGWMVGVGCLKSSCRALTQRQSRRSKSYWGPLGRWNFAFWRISSCIPKSSRGPLNRLKVSRLGTNHFGGSTILKM